MSKTNFLLILLLITLFGFILRFLDYDKYPAFLETADEVMYTWAGVSLLTTGEPSSWSLLSTYHERKNINLWGSPFQIVSPWIEKPPLYSLLSGSFSLFFHQDEFDEVKLSTIRLIPIILGSISIFIIGLLASNLFNGEVALLSSLIYATIPTIVISNRLSISENLLIPIILLTLWLYSTSLNNHIYKHKFLLIGFLCGLALLTRQFGIFLLITVTILLLIKKEWKNMIITSAIAIILGSIYPLMGLIYDWQLFFRSVRELSTTYSQGLPELIQTIFRYPSITHKTKIFLDGSILAGYILLLSAPLWVNEQKDKATILLIFPFVYLTGLMVLESGSGGYFFPWHFLPIYPFIAILIAAAFYELYKNFNYLIFSFLLLTVGILHIRFLLIIYPSLINYWQTLILGIFVIFAVSYISNNKNLIRAALYIFLFLYLGINTLIIVNLPQIYSKMFIS